MNDQEVEHMIKEKGKTAARVTPTDIEAEIVQAYYFTGADGVAGKFAKSKDNKDVAIQVALDKCQSSLNLLTFCVIVLKNGFTVTGESACASPENFDAEIGRKISRQNAVSKIWPLMGYELRSKLAK